MAILTKIYICFKIDYLTKYNIIYIIISCSQLTEEPMRAAEQGKSARKIVAEFLWEKRNDLFEREMIQKTNS